MKIRYSLVVILSLTSPVKSGYVPSQVFLETCSAQDQLRQIACNSYIGGVTDSYLHSGQFCIPPRVTSKEIADFTVNYVLRTREIQRESPISMILYALKAKYPCINQGPNFTFQFKGF